MHDVRPPVVAPRRQLHLQLSLVVVVVVFQFFVLLYWFPLTCPTDTTAPQTSTVELIATTHAPLLRAAVVYLPANDTDLFLPQLRWFHASWREMQKHEPAHWRTDMVVFTHSMIPALDDLRCTAVPRTKSDEPNACVVITGNVDVQMAGLGNDHRVASIAVAGRPHLWVEVYDWLLRTDLDTFLTPAFATWKPKTMVVGPGEYELQGYDTHLRLDSIARKLGYAPATLDHVGTTWYGPRDVLQACARLTVANIEYLDTHEFSAAEKSEPYGTADWPRWHYGMRTLYASHLAINHCTAAVGVVARHDMLDVPTTSDASPFTHAHLRAYANDGRFSKAAFAEGAYRYENQANRSLHRISDYAMRMALDSVPALPDAGANATTATTATTAATATTAMANDVVGSVRAIVVYLPSPLSATIQSEFRTLHRSWQELQRQERPHMRTDLLVYMPPGDTTFMVAELACVLASHRRARSDPPHCIVTADIVPQRSVAFDYDMEAVHVLTAVPTEQYDYVLSVAPDAILAPGLATWAPTTLVTATANYITDTADTRSRLARIASELQLSSPRDALDNFGATWYGPASVVHDCSVLTMNVAKHLYDKEFTPLEKSASYGIQGWPRWHLGVLEFYAAQIAIHHCAPTAEQRGDLLDVPTTKIHAPRHHAVLHTDVSMAQGVYSKHAFAAGAYAAVSAPSLADAMATNTSAYALYMALDAHRGRVPTPPPPPPPPPPQPRPSVDTNRSFVRAAIAYLPHSVPKFESQLRWFHRSWLEMAKHEPSLWRTDILIYTTTMTSVLESLNCSTVGRRTRLEPNKCIVVADYQTIKSPAFNYGFADSINVLTMETVITEPYDYMLRTDLDTFLTPAFATWKPTQLVVGKGAYEFDSTSTTARLASIITKLNYTAATVHNVGSTWYGPASVIQRCAKLSVDMMQYLHAHEFTDEEKSEAYGVKGWPTWHWGVLSMYGGHIAINQCALDTGVVKREDMLDFPTSSSESPSAHAHLHTWQDGERFSKFKFDQGSYAKEDITKLHPDDSIADYAMYMALDAHKAPGLLPGAA